MDFHLDVKDKKLICLLEKNARDSVAGMAREIGVSKEVLNYRLKRFVTFGFIKGYESIIDYAKLGYQLIRVSLNLVNYDLDLVEELMKTLKQNPMTRTTAFLQSNWDLEIELWVKRMSDFLDFYDGIMVKYSSAIQNKRIVVIVKQYVLGHHYFYDGGQILMLGVEGHEVIDAIDERLLGLLHETPKMELLSMSKLLKIPSPTIIYRLKRLAERGILKTVMPKFQVSLIGYNSYRILIMLADTTKRKVVIEFLKNQRAVTKISEIIGIFDVSFEGDFSSTHELDLLLKKLKVFSKMIKDFEVIPLAES
jgi:DNA-binding Lrp family transcriptional regulator